MKVLSQAQVQAELRIYRLLSDIKGISEIYNWLEWPTQPDFGFICMRRYGDNLAAFIRNHGRLSLKDASRVAVAIVSQLPITLLQLL